MKQAMNDKILEALNSANKLLAYFQDFIFGQDGDKITKVRRIIQKAMEEPKEVVPDNADTLSIDVINHIQAKALADYHTQPKEQVADEDVVYMPVGELKELISLALDGYKLHVNNACHREFLDEDIEVISRAKLLKPVKLSSLKAPVISDWDAILERYSKTIHFEVDEVRHILLPLFRWLKENYPLRTPISDDKGDDKWVQKLVEKFRNLQYKAGTQIGIQVLDMATAKACAEVLIDEVLKNRTDLMTFDSVDIYSRCDIELFKNMWYGRNPVHENNADTGEDMFWGTAEIVAKEYTQKLFGGISLRATTNS